MVQTRSGLKLKDVSPVETSCPPKKRKSIPVAGEPEKSKVEKDPESLDDSLKILDRLSSTYDHFICPDDQTNGQFRKLTKFLYGYGQQIQNDVGSLCPVKPGQEKPLRQLLVDGFDNEQIWQQLEVLNDQFVDWATGEVARIASRRQPLSLNVVQALDDDQEDEMLSSVESNLRMIEQNMKKQKKKVQFADLDDDDDDDEFDEQPEIAQTKVNGHSKNVDFFNLKEMEQYLDDQDYLEMHPETKKDAEDEDDIDYFADIPSDDDDESDAEGADTEGEPMYADFFDPPSNTKTRDNDRSQGDDDDSNQEDDLDLDTRDVDEDELNLEINQEDRPKFDPASDDSDDEFSSRDNMIDEKLRALARNEDDDDDDPSKSEFEKSQSKLKKRIEQAERDLLLPHNVRWQFAGETTGTIRPANSLLEEYLQFDHVSRPPPLITDKTTASLEDIIKQRIKDRVFDDVERKTKPKEQPFEFRRRVVLESEKSKVGLAEVYEQEYLKQQQKKKEQEMGAAQAAFMAAGEVEESETRKAIRKQMRSLFRKLDALSAFHFTPKPPEPEVKIINNLPAITVEEAVPDTISDAKLLAPEEVFSTRRQMVLQDKTERSDTDQKRARRLKKKKQKVKKIFLQSRLKLRPAANKSERKAKLLEATEDRKSLSSSTKFFDRLQEKTEIGKQQKNKPKPKITPDQNLARKLKL